MTVKKPEAAGIGMHGVLSLSLSPRDLMFFLLAGFW